MPPAKKVVDLRSPAVAAVAVAASFAAAWNVFARSMSSLWAAESAAPFAAESAAAAASLLSAF